MGSKRVTTQRKRMTSIARRRRFFTKNSVLDGVDSDPGHEVHLEPPTRAISTSPNRIECSTSEDSHNSFGENWSMELQSSCSPVLLVESPRELNCRRPERTFAPCKRLKPGLDTGETPLTENRPMDITLLKSTANRKNSREVMNAMKQVPKNQKSVRTPLASITNSPEIVRTTKTFYTQGFHSVSSKQDVQRSNLNNVPEPLCFTPSKREETATQGQARRRLLISAETSSETLDDQDEESLPDLNVERETVQGRGIGAIRGRRIVNLSYLLEAYEDRIVDHSVTCAGGRMRFDNEQKKGLLSLLRFKCDACGQTEVLRTDDAPEEKGSLTMTLAMGSTAIGIGYRQTKELFALLNIPVPSPVTYRKMEHRVGEAWDWMLKKDMTAAIMKEKEYAIKKGLVENGMPHIVVKVDGAWSRRSFGHSFAAKSGVTCVVGAYTRKVLALGVRNKFCCICQKHEKTKLAVPSHDCNKNYVGASTGMEADIIVESLTHIFETHGVWPKFIIGDGDSNVFTKIQQLTPRGRDTVKLECANHKVRCYTSKLHSICKDTSNNIEGRKLLEPRLKRLTSAARGAIRTNAGQSLATLKRDLVNGPVHVFGDHSDCDTSYCSRKDNEDEVNLVPDMKATNVWDQIVSALQPLVLKADKLLDNHTTNDCESLMSKVSKLGGGKRVDWSTGKSFTTRCSGAGLLFNMGPAYHLQVWEETQGRPLGEVAQRALQEMAHTSELKRRARAAQGPAVRRAERQQRQQPAPANYGATLEQKLEQRPDVEPAVLKRNMDEIMSTLQAEVKTPEDAMRIQQNTVGQADRDDGAWDKYRRYRLTASKHGEVFSKRDTTLRGHLVESIYLKVPLSGDHIYYGIINEKRAKNLYMDQYGVHVEECGIFIRPDLPYLGASPDGLVGEDGIVEVKCFSKLGNNSILDTYNDLSMKKKLRGVLKDEQIETWRERKVKGRTVRSKVVEVMVVPNKKHNYYIQIQSQLAISNRKWCDLILYCDCGIEVFRIERDEELWKKLEKKLTSFYLDYLLPEFADSRISRDLPPREPAYVVAARRKSGLSLPFDA